MKRKTIKIVNQFPAVLQNLRISLNSKEKYQLLDASYFPLALSVLRIAKPDRLLLDVSLINNNAISLMKTYLQENKNIKRGMITTNAGIYYISLCSTFSPWYMIDPLSDVESHVNQIKAQQAN